MKKILFLILLASKSGFATIWTIIDVGFTFSPATITITAGDTVNFNINNTHKVEEVSQSTWNSNGNTPLPGFSTPFGGGMVLPGQLGVGVHYYVCTVHASSGMKGIITVQNPAGIAENDKAQGGISIFPNPSNGMFRLEIEGSQASKIFKVEIESTIGEKFFQTSFPSIKQELDLSGHARGIYHLVIYTEDAILSKRLVIQ